MTKKTLAIFCLYYGGLTGSEMYFYELVKILKKYFHVTVYSNFNYEYLSKTFFDDVVYIPLKADIAPSKYEYIICSHGNYVVHDIKRYVLDINNSFFVNILHSEVLPYEYPLLVKQVSKYVAIRPSISQYVESKFDIKNTELIYNPIDEKRFNRDETVDGGYALFVGTLNYLRLKPFLDFEKTYRGKPIKLLGKIETNYHIDTTNVEIIPPTWEVEKYIKSASVVGGIINGRSYWESKMCGKPTMEYFVDSNGDIIDKKYEDELIDTSHVHTQTIEKQFIELLKI